MSICPDSLRSHYRSGRVLPFVGAGASMSVRWKGFDGNDKRGPSWKELVDQAAKKLGFDNAGMLRVRGSDLQILEYFGIKKHGEFASLASWLSKEINPSDADLRDSAIHKALAGLDNCEIIYTTNYDDFLERAIRLHGRGCNTVVVEADMGKSVPPGAVEVVKFHGDLDYPGHMVVSDRHYEQRLRLNTPMDWRFQADLLGRVVLFIGYSFKDWNVAYLFRFINYTFNERQGSIKGTRAYITVADPSEFERELFYARNMEVIAIRGEQQTDDVVALLQEMAGL